MERTKADSRLRFIPGMASHSGGSGGREWRRSTGRRIVHDGRDDHTTSRGGRLPPSGGGSDYDRNRSHCRSHNDNGVCMISVSWRDEQHPSLLNFISSFLHANSYRLNFLPIAPDFIFNNGGLSVAFIFLTNWHQENIDSFFSRLVKIKRQFRNFYAVVCLATTQQIYSFNRSFFMYKMEIGSPTIVPVRDPEMGFEKIVKIALARGVIKKQDIVSKMKIECERGVQGMDMFLAVITSIPGIDTHDANMLIQAVGSIEAISKASKNFILQNTDLSSEKAECIVRFFGDPEYYLQPNIN